MFLLARILLARWISPSSIFEALDRIVPNCWHK